MRLKLAAAYLAALAVVSAAPAVAAEDSEPEPTHVNCTGSIYIESVTVKWRDSDIDGYSSVQVDPTQFVQDQPYGGLGSMADEFVECLALTASAGRELLVMTTMTVTLQAPSPCLLFCGPSEESFVTSDYIAPDSEDEVRRSTLLDQLWCHDIAPGILEKLFSAVEASLDRWDLEGNRRPSSNILFDWVFKACNW
ncbi:hypothetical protein [Candidatus Poriferisodalis sp.]|uniref:hypothetical protein n=1 Tax=Candidatus Poriferisodalis sp. TaxID=3101277 RepID=UPI003B01DA5F